VVGRSLNFTVRRLGDALKRVATIPVLVLLLASCAKPLPSEKLSYVGEWRERTMYMLISADGSVHYKRVKGRTTTSVDAPVKEFQGNNIVVGIGPFTTTFVVSETPHQDGQSWVMVVDGVRLVRTEGSESHGT
jgi:hypothetical protein